MAPKSTEVKRAWGSSGTVRGTTSTTNGLANTNTLSQYVGAHPAAEYAKTLTTGGYNTWYLPAKDEFYQLYSNKSAVPFASANSFGNYFWSSTEITATTAWVYDMNINQYYGNEAKTNNSYFVRATRWV